MDGSDLPPSTRVDEAWTHACDRCGTHMDEHHCKIVCPRCGYIRDCSDP